MKKVYLAAIAANLGMLSIGMFVGWGSPSVPKLIKDHAETSLQLTLEEASWVTSLLTIGSAVGGIVSVFAVNIIGRKNLMLFTAIPSIIAWLMIAFATSPWELYMSRTIAGIGVGIGLAVTPMYLGEISPAPIRGVLASMSTVAAKIGALIEYCVGPFVSVKNLAFVSFVAPLLFLVSFIWLPESPYQLMRRGDKQKAIDSLVQLRGKQDVCKEVDHIERSVKFDLANETGFREMLFVSGNRRALITVIGLYMTQQLGGMQAVLQYTEMIFNEMENDLEGKYFTIILGVVQVVCTVVCMYVTDLSGRRPLLIISTIGAGSSMTLIAVYFYLRHINMDVSEIRWLPATGLIMYIVMFALGIASLPFTMIGELFPTNVKPLGSMITNTILHCCAFAVTKSYPILVDSVGIHVPFFIFAACNIAGAIFTIFYVPETKGKTLEQIQEKLHNRQ